MQKDIIENPILLETDAQRTQCRYFLPSQYFPICYVYLKPKQAGGYFLIMFKKNYYY